MPNILKINEKTDNPSINLAIDTISINKQALVFTNTKSSAEKTAEDIADNIKKTSDELNQLSENILKALPKPTKQCVRLSKCIKKGIAFHHAGLALKQKELIEIAFKNKVIKIICSTPTLAMGVDLPAFRTILKNLKRYTRNGLTWIPVLEYIQMSGRAGRPSFDSYGESISIADTEAKKDEIYNRYILGKPEEILSKLAVEPVLRTYLLSLIVTRFVKTKKQIFDFFSKTFYAHQFEDTEKLQRIILKMLNLLERFKFITKKQSDFISADKFEDESFSPTILGKRVAELYLDPLTARHLISCLKMSSSKTVTDFSLLQMISNTLEMRPLLRMRAKEEPEIQEILIKHESDLLQPELSMFEEDYAGFINSIKTALFFQNWINEKDEEFLLKRFGIRPGEIRAKLSIAEWLLYASEEIVKILQIKPVIKEITKLRLRLKHGVKEELLPLIRLKEIGRVRGRKLFYNKIKNIHDVKKADLNKLIQILGKNMALNIKKQVDQDFEKIAVKKGKRKGQISLKNY